MATVSIEAKYGGGGDCVLFLHHPDHNTRKLIDWKVISPVPPLKWSVKMSLVAAWHRSLNLIFVGVFFCLNIASNYTIVLLSGAMV